MIILALLVSALMALNLGTRLIARHNANLTNQEIADLDYTLNKIAIYLALFLGITFCFYSLFNDTIVVTGSSALNEAIVTLFAGLNSGLCLYVLASTVHKKGLAFGECDD